jgi:hypothetical protein
MRCKRWAVGQTRREDEPVRRTGRDSPGCFRMAAGCRTATREAIRSGAQRRRVPASSVSEILWESLDHDGLTLESQLTALHKVPV